MDEYGGGFIGLLRWGLYQRMISALPEGVLHMDKRLTSFDDGPDGVTLHFEDGSTAQADVLVGADGLRSTVRRLLWGEEPIRDQGLHLVGGYLFLDGPPPNDTVVMHDRTTQGSYSAIRHEGRYGYEWWVLEAFDPSKPFDEDLKAWALSRAKRFADPLPQLVADTPPEHLQRWPIRDRKPLKQWSKGRATLVGDAAHPTSPYAAYGAGMSIEDGYFLASELERIDVHDQAAVRVALQAFEDRRKPHTAQVTEMAYKLGRMFHYAPAPLRPVRDLVYDHTPLLQKVIGQQTPEHILKQLAEIDAVEAARPVTANA
jgi:2-polyprenyl-6-methoxyphenol hydroxylase-like FAD-dependent oxidoreductase